MSWHTQNTLHHTDHKPHSTDPHWWNQLQPLSQNLHQCLNPFCSLSLELLASAPHHRPSPLRILKGHQPLQWKKQKPHSQSSVLKTFSGFFHHCYSFLQSPPRSWCSLWVHNSPKQEHQTSQEQGKFLPFTTFSFKSSEGWKWRNLWEQCSLVCVWGCCFSEVVTNFRNRPRIYRKGDCECNEFHSLHMSKCMDSGLVILNVINLRSSSLSFSPTLSLCF